MCLFPSFGRPTGRTRSTPLLGALFLGAGLLLPTAAGAVIQNSRCVANLQAPLTPGNSCTANDVTFILVGLGDQSNGCVSVNDTLSIKLGAKLQNTSGQTRYDIGLFIYNDLGTGDPTPDAYSGRQCAVETLKPPYPTVNTSTCPPLNLSGSSGPFFNADGNGCADLVKGMCNNAEVFMKFPEPITVKCSDNVGANGAVGGDGFVDIPTCTTWGNNAGQVGPNGVCSTEADVHPGTGAKCNCQVLNSDVPVARLAPSCSCTPTAVRPGQSAACTVSFTNTVPNCTATAATVTSPERFKCGTSSFLRFKVGYSSAQGQVLSASSTPTENTSGTVAVDTTNQQVVWTPRNTTASGTSLGVIGPNQSGSMTYQFYVAPSVASGTTIQQTVTMFWADGGPPSWTSEVAQPVTATCSFQVSNAATWARVSSFAAREEGGRVVVEWETAAEVGTAAFEVERLDPASGRFARVTEHAVPAVEQLPGGRYRLADPAAPLGGPLTYRLVEIDRQGGREVFGPYRVTVERGKRRAGDEREVPFAALAKEVSPRLARAKAAPATATAATAPGGRARIGVTADGMTRVRTRDAASALGMSAEEAAGQIRAGRLRLSRGGQDVAWQPAPDGDGLVFYGEAVKTSYTGTGVYWLERGRGTVAATVAAQPATGPAAASFEETLHLETDAIPGTSGSLPAEDFWIWKSLFPGFPGFDRATLGVDVPAPAPGAAAALAIHFHGFASTQRADVRVNGRPLGEVSWTGSGPATVTLTLPPDLLRDGANQIEIVVLEAARGLWLDSFDLTYPRLYRAQADRLAFRATAGAAVSLAGFQTPDVAVWDLAQPLAPRRLGGLSGQPRPDGTWGVSFLAPGSGPFLAATSAGLGTATPRASAPADLRNPGRGAEYVVIAPATLRAEAQRLADLRSAQGLSAMVVDLADVMDVFNDGVYDPLAIRRFLAEAVRTWPAPPRYVVLAGKGTYDPRDLLGLGTNLVPTLLVTTPDGIATADAALADLDGSGLPAVALGRIPAATAAELRAYVDKIAAYESAPGGDWTSRALLAADDADSGGDFPATSGGLAATLPGSPARVDLVPGQIQDSRARLFDALRQGQALFNYVGHGGLDRLASEGLLLTADVARLGNAPRLPVMTALTCLISQFGYPSVTSLGEELVLRADGGAAALYGPTWLSHNAPASTLGRHLLPRLAAPDGGRLGDRLLRGLADYAAAGGERETLRVYTLLGDPALAVRRQD